MKVLIVDDHTFLREGLRELFENQSEMEVIGEAENGKAAVETCRKEPVDVVIMDISMPVLNGIEAARQIKGFSPDTKVIVLSIHAEKNIVKDALKAGVDGYLLKNSAFREIHEAIRIVVGGQTYISPQIATMVVSEFLNTPSDQNSETTSLTGRERQILRFIAEGKRSKEIALELNIGVRTVEKVRSRIMEKLNLHTVAELTKYAICQGITTIEY